MWNLPTYGCARLCSTRPDGILPGEGWQHLFRKQPHLPVDLIDLIVAKQPHIPKRADQMVYSSRLEFLHHLGYCGHGTAQELMIFPKDPDVVFSGVWPNVRGHDTDKLQIPVAAIGTDPGHTILQLLRRHGPWNPPVTQHGHASERWGGHAADEHGRATGLRRFREAGHIGKRRILALKGGDGLITPEGPEHLHGFVEHGTPLLPRGAKRP